MKKPFRFGVQGYAPASAGEWRALARKAESLGFSSFHLADHVIGPGPALAATGHPVQTVAAIPAMAVAAEATTTIKIGCRVLCVDYRNPVMLAKELATLDFFSEGRLEIGLGAGWLQNEYDAMGITFDRAGIRLDRLEEVIALIRASSADGELNMVGKHVHAVGFEAVPKPTQRPMPPIMIGGGAQRILGIAGREADIVSLNFNNSSGKLGPEGIGSATAELTDQKIQWIKDGAGSRFDDIEIEIAAYFTVVTPDGEATRAKMAPMFGLTPEVFAEHPNALIGSVDEICDRIVERRERYGISYVTFGSSVMEAAAPIVEKLSGK
ncbi:MAG: TIGR03621 family F420-dependent LLM class oxidoreductase [Ilumatobacteraceae bacterium]|nr:TIGR03621 family F420-dependent LLM class oxidoreductase [Ilumatobacteraceae bacterium]